MRIFEFDTSEGEFIVASKNAKEAIMFFFAKYMDDIQTDELVGFEGITIRELDEKEITMNRKIYNEGEGVHELTSYKKLADTFARESEMLVSPIY